MAFLSRNPIEPAGLLAEVVAPERGGIASFVGLVRDHHGGRGVSALAYSAYEPMAEAVCGQIVSEAEARWPVRVALRHRLGDLAIGAVAVAVAVAGDHRDEAFAACRYVIEELKRRVPIWKQEMYSDGTAEWVNQDQESGVRGQGSGMSV
ncbi:MAG TPA: molybdenum cofactor biosynthesis protein MoaE [Gemmatimonadales bacterium]|nr:molybdenum cofactor biosynthesis protein MoaE [Gemmatimonadales bacterium]